MLDGWTIGIFEERLIRTSSRTSGLLFAEIEFLKTRQAGRLAINVPAKSILRKTI